MTLIFHTCPTNVRLDPITPMPPRRNLMLSQWISWARRRASASAGTGHLNPIYTRTTKSHVDAGNGKALCGRKIGVAVIEDNLLPHCPRCEGKLKL